MLAKERLIFNFRVGVEALITNKLRAFLTSLGIIFGVAAVISMLAIGAGAEREILEQIKQVGSNNIVIKSKFNDPNKDNSDASKKDNKETKKFSPGLTIGDAENISETISAVSFVSPEIEIETSFMREGQKNTGKLIGVTNKFFEIAGVKVGEGKYFTENQVEQAEAVCIIGKQVKTKYFAKSDPIGQAIKCGNVWLTVVGVLESGVISDKSVEKLSVRNYNSDIYTPIRTILLRYKNRSNVTVMAMKNRNSYWGNNEQNKKIENHNQLDRLVINLSDSKYIEPSLSIIEKILKRRHNQVADYEIIVPELLLKQEQKTKQLFNIVLGVIASISLLVGGIGIMNIMLASVLERIKEIGLRLALGAKKTDIIMQFMSEAVSISFTGGLIGISLGILISYMVEKLADIQTIITPFSVILSFGVAVIVGLIFGIFPAKRASDQNPIESLRYE
ncbi:MAG: ABC transporter permease [Spirosomataceae bacterium]